MRLSFVNEEKPAGEHEVEFNFVGTSRDLSLPSGISAKGGYASDVYFYSLSTGNFLSTKKMILLK